ncbi:MAG: peptidylprolyl isomerase [Gemmatimonadota bacterium]
MSTAVNERRGPTRVTGPGMPARQIIALTAAAVLALAASSPVMAQDAPAADADTQAAAVADSVAPTAAVADTQAAATPDTGAVAALPAPAEAAADTAELVDRIAAIVGDTAILYSDVVIALFQMNQSGTEVPPAGTPEFDVFSGQVLEDLIDDMVLLQKAKTEDIQINDEFINQEADKRFREIRNSFPSASEFQEAVTQSGQTMVQYRQVLRSQVYGRALVESYINQNRGNLPPVSVSEEEILETFDEVFANQTRGAEISFEHVVIELTPSEAAEDSALERATLALAELDAGESFEVVTRRYSEDGATRERGGDLGWNSRRDLVPEFARAAWAARTGEPIGPVRSPYGYHLIKVENVRGGERRLRHILVRPAITEADAERVRVFGQTLADSIRGGASVASLAEEHGAKNIPVHGDLPLAELERRLGPEYAQALEGRQPGDVAGPFPTSRLIPGRPAFVVVRVVELRPEGNYTLDETREEIRSRLSFNKGYERFLEELRDEVYIQVLF